MDEILSKIDKLAGNVSKGTIVTIKFKCGCELVTIKGCPRYTGFLKFCKKHEEIFEGIEKGITKRMMAKIEDGEGIERRIKEGRNFAMVVEDGCIIVEKKSLGG